MIGHVILNETQYFIFTEFADYMFTFTANKNSVPCLEAIDANICFKPGLQIRAYNTQTVCRQSVAFVC